MNSQDTGPYQKKRLYPQSTFCQRIGTALTGCYNVQPASLLTLPASFRLAFVIEIELVSLIYFDATGFLILSVYTYQYVYVLLALLIFLILLNTKSLM